MAHSVAGGTAVLLLARVAPPAASFGVFYLALRYWEPDTWGFFHLLLSAQAVLQMAAGLGVDLLVLQKGSARPKEIPQLIWGWSLLLLRVGFVLGAALVAVVACLTDAPQSLLAAVFLGGTVPAASLSPALEASWVSLGRAPRLAPIVLLEHGGRLLASFVALSAGGGPAWLALVIFASKWLGVALLYLPLRDAGRPAEPPRLGTLLREASPYALFFAASALLSRMDSLTLALFGPMDEVGYYGAATRLVLACTIASQAFGLALYPRLAASRSNLARYHRAARTSLISLAAASFVPAALLHTFPEAALRALRVETYLPAAPLLGILSLALPAWFSIEALFRCLLAEERLRAALRVAGLQTVTGVPAFIVGGSLYGATGIAMTSVVVAWLGAVGYLFSSHRGGLVLWSSWATVVAIGAALTSGMKIAAPSHPIVALMLLAAYALAVAAGISRWVPGHSSPSEDEVH